MSLNCCNEHVLTSFEYACFRLLSVKKSFLEVFCCLQKTNAFAITQLLQKVWVFNICRGTGAYLIAV